jgi:hypothetical protein
VSPALRALFSHDPGARLKPLWKPIVSNPPALIPDWANPCHNFAATSHQG